MSILTPPQRFARPRRQLVATGGQAPQDASAASTIYSRAESRMRVRSAPVAVTDIQIGYGAFYLTAAGTRLEAALPNALSVAAALETLTPAIAYAPAYWGGKLLLAQDAGAAPELCDPIGVDIAANTEFFIRTNVEGDVGFRYTSFFRSLFSGDGLLRSTNATTQIYGTGALTAGSSGVSGPATAPTLIVGVPVTPCPAVAFITDSIGSGSGDLTSTGITAGGYFGWPARGMINSDGAGGVYPWHNMGVAGSAYSSYAFPGATRRMNALQFASHAVVQVGTNDLANTGFAFAALQAAALDTWGACRRRGVKVFACKVMPRTTSTDSWATAVNQTPVAGFETGGRRDQYNTWLDTQRAAGNIDGIINPNPYVEDQTTQGVWVTNGTANYPTTDGVHPSTAVHTLAATAMNAAVRGFSVDRTGRAN